jgi:hypothetical protein
MRLLVVVGMFILVIVARIGTEEGFGVGIVVIVVLIAMGVIVTIPMIMGGGGRAGGRMLMRLVMAAVATRQGEDADRQDSRLHQKSHGSPPTYCSSM